MQSRPDEVAGVARERRTRARGPAGRRSWAAARRASWRGALALATARSTGAWQGRWVVATVPTTVPVAPPATRTTRAAARSSAAAVGRWGSGVVPPGVDDGAAELVAAPAAGLAGPAVAPELELVAAGSALDGAVVAQGRAAVGDALLEHLAERAEQAAGLDPGDGAPRRGGSPARHERPRRRRCCPTPASGRCDSSCVFTRARLRRRFAPQPAVVEGARPTARAPGRRASAASAYSPAGTTPTRPNRRTSRSSSTAPSSSAHHARTYGSRSPGPQPQLAGHAEVDDRARGRRRGRASRYLPPPADGLDRRPAASTARGELRPTAWPHASTIRRPSTSGSSSPPHRLHLRQLRHRWSPS